jgi:hypothetical protein
LASNIIEGAAEGDGGAEGGGDGGGGGGDGGGEGGGASSDRKGGSEGEEEKYIGNVYGGGNDALSGKEVSCVFAAWTDPLYVLYIPWTDQHLSSYKETIM